MGVKASRKVPKKRGRDDWDDPPVKEWFRAKFVKAKEREGDWGPGWNFQFKCIDKSLSDLSIGSIWGLQWEPCHPGRDLYDWLQILSDGEFEEALAELEDDDDELDFDVDDYSGKIVEIFCEKKRHKGKTHFNVTDIRLPKRKKKRRSSSSDERPAKKRRRSSSSSSEERPARRKKRRRSREEDAGEEQPARRKKRRASSDEDSSSRRSSRSKERPAKKKRAAKRRPSY